MSAAITPLSTSASDLPGRMVTAAVALPVLTALIFTDSAAFLVLMGVAAGTALWEYSRLSALAQGRSPRRAEGTVLIGTGLLGLASIALFSAPTHAALGFAAAILFGGFALATRRGGRELARGLLRLTTGALWIAAPLGLLARLHAEAGAAGPAWIVFALAVIWMGDTGAYFAGRRFGQRPLAPSISPKKTWEGALGGLAAALAFAALIHTTGLLALPLSTTLLIAGAASPLGVLGDLTESRLKRAAGVKNSGQLLPGHGGMLDRIDALLFAAPLLYAASVLS